MRLSRKVIIGLATIAALAVSGALIWALTQSPRKPDGGGELYNTETKPTPDALAALPRDYAAIPKPSPPPVPPGVPPLGPPLPGDLGRPMLSAGVPPSEGFPCSRSRPAKARPGAGGGAHQQTVCNGERDATADRACRLAQSDLFG